jgi:hypothetical protein
VHQDPLMGHLVQVELLPSQFLGYLFRTVNPKLAYAPYFEQTLVSATLV